MLMAVDVLTGIESNRNKHVSIVQMKAEVRYTRRVPMMKNKKCEVLTPSFFLKFIKLEIKPKKKEKKKRGGGF